MDSVVQLEIHKVKVEAISYSTASMQISELLRKRERKKKKRKLQKEILGYLKTNKKCNEEKNKCEKTVGCLLSLHSLSLFSPSPTNDKLAKKN